MPGRVHGEDQIADAVVLGRVRFGTHQAEHHVGVLSARGPDLLAVDDPFVAIELGLGGEGRQVRAGAGFGIALAPRHLAAYRGRHQPLLLLLGAEFEHRRHQPVVAGVAGRHASAGELFGDDARLQDVRLGAVAAVFARNRARRIALLDQQLLPFLRRVRAAGNRGPLVRRLVLVAVEERAHLVAERLVLGAVFEVHAILPTGRAAERSADRASARASLPGTWPSPLRPRRPAR